MTGTNPFGRSTPLLLLGQQLDPPEHRKAFARDCYDDLGRWLKAHAEAPAGREVRLYPQGSFNLGTTNWDPFTESFDVDGVICVAYTKDEVTQQRLNEIVGGWLREYVTERQNAGHRLAPTLLEPGKRAWTLHYGDHFHIDILAVVPDVAGELESTCGEPSWLTDKQLVRWQPTNPNGFAEHFREVSRAERVSLKEALAKSRDVEVEELPDDAVKTTLQVVVQLLKRHRDETFRDDPHGLAPPSAVVTALATAAYQARTPNGGPLDEVVEAVCQEMLEQMPHTLTALLVPNPTCPRENYADRYDARPDKVRALRKWLAQVKDDIGALTTVHDLSRVTKSIDQAFGEGLGRRVAERIGLDTKRIAAAGALASTSTGTLGDEGYPHERHDFYGQPQT